MAIDANNEKKKDERPTRPFSQKLVESGLGRRFLALVLDVAIFMLPSYMIANYAIIPAYVRRDGGAHAQMQTAYSLMADTQLFAVTSSGGEYSGTNYYYLADTGNSVTPGQGSYSSGNASSTADDRSGDAYLFYHEVVYHYYTVYLPKGLEGGEYYGTDYIEPYRDSDGNPYTSVEQYRAFYYQNAMGLPDPEVFNATASLEERYALNNDCYFTYAVDEDNNADLTVPAVLKSNRQQEVNGKNTATLSTLNTFFFDTSASSPGGVYGKACNNFTGSQTTNSPTEGIAQLFYATAANTYTTESLAAFMFIYFPLLIVVEFIVPMCDKYGRTIGKWVFRLRVCRLLDSGEGVLMTWWQRMMRCFYMTAILSPLGLFTIAPLLIGFLFMVSYFILMMGKRHQSIHDMFLHTVVVNKKDSKIYADEEEIYDEKMEELAKERANLYRPPEILDLSTINSARDLARKYDRFDDIENEEVEVKTYTEYKKPDPVEEKSNEDDYFDAVDDGDEDYEDPLGLGDVGPQKKVNPEEVNLSKDDDE